MSDIEKARKYQPPYPDKAHLLFADLYTLNLIGLEAQERFETQVRAALAGAREEGRREREAEIEKSLRARGIYNHAMLAPRDT